MIISQAFAFTLNRKPAAMFVLRNNGYCWGRAILDGGAQHDVSSRLDLYERDDHDAAHTLIRKAQRGGLEPIAGSPL